MISIQPFKRQGHYTVMDNALIDYVMPKLGPSTWKVLCFIMRKTWGWSKDGDQISYSQIKESGVTGSATISAAIKELKKYKLILVVKADGKTSAYMLNRECVIQIPEEEVQQDPPSETEEVPLQKLNRTHVQKLNTPLQKLKTQNNNIYILGAQPEIETSVRESEEYIDLQNAVIEVCKKLNILALDQEDIREIDILYQIGAEEGCSGSLPDEIRQHYGRNGQKSWWYRVFWKGKRGQFPTVSDIRETLGQARASADTVAEDGTADLAWPEVLNWIKGNKPFSELGDKSKAAISSIGEYEFRTVTERNLPVLKSRFSEAFNRL